MRQRRLIEPDLAPAEDPTWPDNPETDERLRRTVDDALDQLDLPTGERELPPERRAPIPRPPARR